MGDPLYPKEQSETLLLYSATDGQALNQSFKIW